ATTIAARGTLHHQVLAHEGLGDIQVVDVEVVVVFGVRNGRIQNLADVGGDALAAEFKLVQRLLNRQTADRCGHQVQLLRADANVDQLGASLGGADAAGVVGL